MTKTVAESILQGMKEALAHARGEIELPTRIVITGRKFGPVPPDPEREPLPVEYPGTLIPFNHVLEAEPEQQKMALEYAPEAESEQHGPPKAKVVGSTPTGDSNTEDDDGL